MKYLLVLLGIIFFPCSNSKYDGIVVNRENTWLNNYNPISINNDNKLYFKIDYNSLNYNLKKEKNEIVKIE
jgi:hypothetical protein